MAQNFTIPVTAQPDPPVAVDDAVSVNEDDPAGVTFDVLANDSDPDGDPWRSTRSTARRSSAGTLTDNGGGSFTYIPGPAFSGSETFTYTVADGTGATATATVTITTSPSPTTPSPAPTPTPQGKRPSLTVAAPGLLGNDYDEDGDPLTVARHSSSGRCNGLALVLADGSFVYTPNPLFVGTDSFTYQVSDGTGRTRNGTRHDHRQLGGTAVDALPPAHRSHRRPVGHHYRLTPRSRVTGSRHDCDGDPGLTIKHGDGKETMTDGAKYQLWRYVLPGAGTTQRPRDTAAVEHREGLQDRQGRPPVRLPL